MSEKSEEVKIKASITEARYEIFILFLLLYRCKISRITDKFVKCGDIVKVHLNCFRFQTFRSTLQALFSSEHVQTLPLSTIIEKLAKDYPDSKYSKSEIDAAVERMTEDNHIMLSDGHIFLV